MQCPNGTHCATLTIEAVSINRLPYFLPSVILFFLSLAFGLVVMAILLKAWINHGRLPERLSAWSVMVVAVCMGSAYIWSSLEQDAYDRDYGTQVMLRQTAILTNGLFDTVSITATRGQDGHRYVTYIAKRDNTDYRGEIQPIGPETYLLTVELAPAAI